VKISTPVEHEQTERGLAVARVLLAIGLLGAQYLGLAEAELLAGRRPPLPHGPLLVLLFGIYSVAMLVLIRTRKVFNLRWRLLLHSLDVLWPCLFSLSTGTLSDPCLTLALFTVLAAALRSGLHAAVTTAGVISLLVLLQAIYLPSVNSMRQAEVYGSFAPPELAMRAPYLLLVGVVFGYLLGRERRLLAESSVLERLAAQLNRERGLGNVLRIIGRELMGISLAERVLFVGEVKPTGRALLWEFDGRSQHDGTSPQARALDAAKRDSYLFPMEADCWHAVRLPWPKDQIDVVTLDIRSNRISEMLDPRFDLLQVCPNIASVAMFSIGSRDGWTGRFVLINPTFDSNRSRSLQFLQRLVHLASPVVHDAHHLHTLRNRAKAFERARLVRELHDGVIPSLAAAAMQVDTLRRRVGPRSAGGELDRVQQVLHEEALKLRDVMQRLKPISVEPDEGLKALADLVDRFQRDTGIAASLGGRLDPARVTPRTYAKILRIVQEALINVRKHSGAKHVSIRLVPDETTVRLTIEDNGLGFRPPSHQGHEHDVKRVSNFTVWPPRPKLTVIEECVRAIDGRLSVESSPRHGVRLEISIPLLTRPRWQQPRQLEIRPNGPGFLLRRWAATMTWVAAIFLRARADWIAQGKLDWHRRGPK
jgi:signal transduction histidine kinase